MAGYKDRLEIKEGTSSSSGSDDVTESSGSSSADESLQAKLPPIRDVGSTVEFPEEVNQKSQKLKKKKRLTKRERSAKLLAKRELDRMCMVKPNAISDREEERILIRRATKGVVHLFNAVAERQKELGAKLALKDKGDKELLARELGSAAFKKKLAQKLALKDEDRNSETREEWLSDSDMKEEPLRKGQDLMDTSEVKTEPESDDD